MNFGNLPGVLIATARFCNWIRGPDEKGVVRKEPINPRTGYGAKTNDISTFTDYDTAVAAAQSKGYGGIGLGLFDGVSAIDIDGCVLEDGTLSPMAQDIIDIMHAYAEFSPSGKGIHILFSAKGFTYDKAIYYIMNHATTQSTLILDNWIKVFEFSSSV